MGFIGAHFFTNGIQVVAVSFYPKLVEKFAAFVYKGLISMLISQVSITSVQRQIDNDSCSGIWPGNGWYLNFYDGAISSYLKSDVDALRLRECYVYRSAMESVIFTFSIIHFRLLIYLPETGRTDRYDYAIITLS